MYPEDYQPPKFDEDPVELGYHAEERLRRTDPDYRRSHRGGYYMNLQSLSQALIEEKEKERALELFKVQREQELQSEYERRIEEMTSDYRSKLRDLDMSYTDKKSELDRERQAIESASSLQPTPSLNSDFLVNQRPLHVFEDEDEPLHENDTREFEFEIIKPAGWNLAQKP